jgi:mitotic spindle assembly checkpoint protein MAD1
MLMIDSSASASRRPLSGSMSVTSLQRRVMELEAKEREGQLEIEELRSENGRLKIERRMLHEGEEQERNTGQEREKQFSEERVCYVAPSALLSCSSCESTAGKAHTDNSLS